MQRKKPSQQLPRIRVVGVGGGGITAINNLLGADLYGVDFLAVDTDIETLQHSIAPLNLRIGVPVTDGRGLAGDVERGRRASLTAVRAIGGPLRGSDLVFILAGLGGGTGTGAAPVIARIARRLGALVVGLVTFPFTFEGQERADSARRGVTWLRNWTDTLVVIPNNRLLEEAGGAIGFHETYRLAHTVWHQSVRGITDLVNHSGLINVDFADVRSIMSEGGGAIIATGHGIGHDRAKQAAEQASRSDLLGITIDGAQGVLFNVTGGPDISLLEVEQAAEIITHRVDRDANVIFGAAVNHSMIDEVRITVIATGFTFKTRRPQPNQAATRSGDEIASLPWLEPTPSIRTKKKRP